MTTEHRQRTPLPGDDREGWMMFRYAGPLLVFELTPEQVDIRDISHGLSLINRFNGQSAQPIPVLWHSLMVMELCADQNRDIRLEALFHDGGETYAGDWIRPLKSLWGDGLARLRERVQETVFEAAGVPRRGAKLSTAVHEADNLMVRFEMTSPWGYWRIPTWYEPPTRAGAAAVQRAIARIGQPPDNALARNRMRTRFLHHAAALVNDNAPIRASVDHALRSAPPL